MDDFAPRPTAFVIAATRHGPMLVNRHDYATADGVTYGVGHELLNASCYAQDEIAVVLRLLEARRDSHGAGVIALDCGANVGVHTIEWSRRMYGWGAVVAIEAQERLFYALAGNLTMNNCSNARAIWAAVGAASGTIKIPVPNYFIPSSFGSLELIKSASNEYIGQDMDYDGATCQEVRVIAIDDMPLRRVDLIKIDVEGMELDVLAGARRTITRHKPHMLIEVMKSSEESVKEFVDGLGYNSYRFGINVIAVHKDDPAANHIRVSHADAS